MTSPGREPSVTAVANREVPFATALAWTGLADGMRDRGVKVTCPGCGEPDALRLWADHGWCFAERKRFSTVLLLAAAWDMDAATAAATALERVGYVPPDYAALLLAPPPEPEPGRDDLAEALRIWCRSACPDWTARQYDEAVSRKLADCLSVLPGVHSEQACRKWLAVSKRAMGRVLSAPGGNQLDCG